jgi:hypothetical protein
LFIAATLVLVLLRSVAVVAGPTPPAASCGNGLLDTGESCEVCPADCTPAACKPGKPTRRFTVMLAPPRGQEPTTATVRIAYRSDRLHLPAAGAAPAVRTRLTALAKTATLTPNALGYALRVVATGTEAFTNGPLFAVEFDSCAGPPAGTTDLSCVVEGCAGAGTPITGCTCSIAAASG